MNLREAKKTTMTILDRWRFLSSRRVEPRYVVANAGGAAVFRNEARARRYAETQINPAYYGIITIGGP
jgi:hypothetical protein